MDILDSELEKANKEIFRFEALQEYFSDGSDELENELSRQWKEKKEIDMDLMKEWHDFIKKKIKEGVRFDWVRLVEFPLNEYTKSELYLYKRRVAFGIDIRIITKEKFDELGIEVKDFYLFDDKNVLLMNYGKSNEYLNSEFKNEELEKYKNYMGLLLNNSVPVEEFEYH